MISAIIVDDQELVREGIKALIDSTGQVKVVALAASGEELVGLYEKIQSDVVLLDISMPGIGGLEGSKRLLQRFPKVKIIILSNKIDGPAPRQLVDMGVKGYLSKNSSLEEMLKAICEVKSGGNYMTPEVANHLVFDHINNKEGGPFGSLSQRELEVTDLIIQGLKIKEIADKLNVSDKTINTYRYRIFDKLEVKNDVGLALLAASHGLID